MWVSQLLTGDGFRYQMEMVIFLTCAGLSGLSYVSSACLLPLERARVRVLRSRQAHSNAWSLAVLQGVLGRLWGCPVMEVMVVPMGPIHPESGECVSPGLLL